MYDTLESRRCKTCGHPSVFHELHNSEGNKFCAVTERNKDKCPCKNYVSKFVEKGVGMRMHGSVMGSGNLSAGELKDILVDVPDEASVKVTVQNDQRDGQTWCVEAEWGGPATVRSPYTTGQVKTTSRIVENTN